jgi:hypothetical protein
MPSIYNQKMHQVKHEYIQMQLKKAYQAYVQNDIKIVELFEL